MPKISVILPSFNHDKFLLDSIQSVLKQTFSDFELIVYDDASSDRSWEIIQSFKDPRIRAFQSEVNAGPNFIVNKSIFELAKGDYIAIHNSDDVWEPHKLQTQIDFLEKNRNIGAVFSNASIITESGETLKNKDHFYSTIFNQTNRTKYEWLNFFFLSGNALCHPSILIRKQCYLDCGPYKNSLHQLPDFDMWIRLCFKYDIHVLPEKLVKYRVLDNELNTSGSRPETRIRSHTEHQFVLKEFARFVDSENIFKIFPEFDSYDRGHDTDSAFVLAQICLESGDFFIRKALALDILLDIMKSPQRRIKIEEVYGFTVKNLIAITGKTDPYSVDKLVHLKEFEEEKERLIQTQEQMIEELQTSLSDMRASSSWKITAPLRNAVTKVALAKKMIATLRSNISILGGIKNILVQVLKVYRRDGLLGVYLKAKKVMKSEVIVSKVSQELLENPIVRPYYLISDAKKTPINFDRNLKVAVHLHLFYPEMSNEFISRFKNIPTTFDLFISVPQNVICDDIKNIFKSSLISVGQVFVEQVPNQGRDIAPLIVQFGKRLSSYDLIAHVHTKKSPHNVMLEEWFNSSMDLLMGNSESGSHQHVRQIFELLSNEADIIVPENSPYIIRDQSGWAGNFDLAKYILEKHTQISIDNYKKVAFSEGSMFWAKTDCLQSFLNLPLKFSDFPKEPISADGTLAHALERLLLVFASQNNKKCIRLVKNDSINDFRFYENQIDYSTTIQHKNIKVLSYYLPQFHPIPENDLWHGKGFTEWTKVKLAQPLFVGHYQQHIPHPDIGYYLLDSARVLQQQAEMMKKHGVYGQIFYHYWFTGKLILEKPAQMLLRHPDVDMPFCFCWANENWTRRWDGNEKEILLGQNYSEQDAKDFIQYLIPFFKDSRYIQIEDRPVLYIYRPSSIPDIELYINTWGSECEKVGLKKPYVVAVLTRGAVDPNAFKMDAAVERVLHDWTAGGAPEIKQNLVPYEPMRGSALSYADVADFYAKQTEVKDFTYFRSLVPMWDNTARYGKEAILLHESSPEKFQDWFESSIKYTEKNLPTDRQFIIVNAWNEWAEGAHLEPDSRHGYAYLNSIGRALSNKKYADDLNYSARLPADQIHIHFQFSDYLLTQFSEDPHLKNRFLKMLKASTVLKYCTYSSHFSEFTTTPLNLNQDINVYTIDLHRACVFDQFVLEKMIKTSVFFGCNVISNAYGIHHDLVQINSNGTANYSAAFGTPILVRHNSNSKIVKVRTDARAFVTSASKVKYENKQKVTTIIRFHKSGEFHELNNALCCLLAMADCQVIPYIAAQDLEEDQKAKLKEIISHFSEFEDFKIEVEYYHSKDGNTDLRSKMLNESLRKVKTQFATFLDYDDLLLPQAYHWLLHRLKTTSKAVSFGRVYSTSYNSKDQILIERTKKYEYGYTYKDFVYNNHAPVHSFMIDVSKVDISKIQYFEDQKYMEDYLLTLQLFSQENCDWESLRFNFYIGDYIHSVDRSHTLAFSSQIARRKMTVSKEYLKCNKRIEDLHKKIVTSL